ncbi:hypothetical protein FA15DRAFT_436220 [Coprinopsis marcescibilis]|uniref:CBM1 domain-containing protein n=1 Tax=Coprinopsis marcescibilis TaxID=230819 RepID=A0A5C3KTW6_COPMA|nr:hypothetical protein FA15DRAFT_436220 [Coprinopsis marcescibilis]
MFRLLGLCAYLLVFNVLLVVGQQAARWCDGLTSVCFWRFHEPTLDIGWGYLFPQPGRNELIAIYTAPAGVGWIGNSLGGSMRANPLIIGWTDESSKPVISVRSTANYAPPQLLRTGPKVTILGSSGSNGTHQRIVYRCENCTTWTGGSGGINLNGNHVFGYASHAAIKPIDSSNPDSTLYQHTIASMHQLNTVNARSADYDADLAKLVNAAPLVPPKPTGTLTDPGPTPTATTTPLCPGAPNSIYSLHAATGWKASAVLSRLSSPRGLAVDSKGNLLVLQREIGITGHQVDARGCVTSSKVVIEDKTLNHAVDVVGNKLYSTSKDDLWVWDYNPDTMTATNRKTLVTELSLPDHELHITRTIHVSRKYPDFISVSVGSDGNLDIPSFDRYSGRSQIRVFDIRELPPNGAPFNSPYGKIFGHGLRNDVGIAEDKSGAIWSIDNSLDDAHRMINGTLTDIHEDNPADAVFLLGNPTAPNEYFYAGYPYCFAVWEPSAIPDANLQPGDWFVQDNTGKFNDSWCRENAVDRPHIILPPHAAPLDLKFGVKEGDDNLYVPLHGSSARSTTLGYKVVVFPGNYATGAWRSRANLAATKSASTDLLFNKDESQCRAGCFRPVALAWSANGDNLYVSSDSSGEVFLVRRDSADPPVVPTTSLPQLPTTTNTGPQPTQSLWGQCGGQGYNGPSLCTGGTACKLLNKYFSQCIPI